MIWYVGCLAAGSFVSNLATFIYTRKTFDTTQSIYYVLTLDSGITWICNLLFLLIYTFEEFLPNTSVICAMVWYTMKVPPTIFPVLNFLTSFIKHKKIEASMKLKTWMTDKKIIQKANVTTLAGLIFIFFEVSANAILDLRMSPLYSNCINETNQSINGFIQLILNIIPIVILILITAVYDMKSLRYIREFRRTRPNSNASSNEERTLLQETPFRSTILNFIGVLLPMVYSAVMLESSENDTVASWSKLTSIVCLALMCKNLIVFWTFRVYQGNMHTNQAEDRERKRQIEINEAQKRKREIASKRENRQMESIEMT